MIQRSLLLTLTLTLLSCATPQGFLLTNQTEIDMSAEEYNDHISRGLSSWKERHIKSKLESFIKHFEYCARSSKRYTSQLIETGKIYEMLSRGYYLLANNHTTDLIMQKRYWETGAYWAEKSLYTNERFKRGVGEYGEYVPALKYVKKEQAGALYWYLANIGKWAKNSGIATSLKYSKLIKNMIKRIRQFDRNYFYGGLDRYWGAYYSVIPFFAGGNLDKSKSYFERSIKVAPNYLGTQVLYAELYARKIRDDALFKKILNKVINYKLDKSSKIYSENYLEQQRGKDLLKEFQ